MLNFSLLGCLALNLHKSRLGGGGLVLKLVVGFVLRIVSGGGCVNQFLC